MKSVHNGPVDVSGGKPKVSSFFMLIEVMGMNHESIS